VGDWLPAGVRVAMIGSSGSSPAGRSATGVAPVGSTVGDPLGGSVGAPVVAAGDETGGVPVGGTHPSAAPALVTVDSGTSSAADTMIAVTPNGASRHHLTQRAPDTRVVRCEVQSPAGCSLGR
jgi:hypothetical protein